jgi:hypothetical protein
VLVTGTGNPLAGRQALVRRNAAFPATNTLTLNFGTALAGQSVRIRFVIATDAAAGDFGWEIDNVNVQGITNTPFPQFTANLVACRVR